MRCVKLILHEATNENHIMAMTVPAVVAVFNALIATHNTDLDYKEVYCMSENIWHEARDQGVDGQIMVAQVVMNRVKLKNRSVCRVVHQPEQFSWTISGKARINFDDPIEAKAFDDVVIIAIEVMKGEHDNLVGKADHYYNPDKESPTWPAAMTLQGKWKDHVFYASERAESRL